MRLSAVCRLFTCFLLAFTGCNNDSSLNITNIEGIWKDEIYFEEFNRISRLEYNFKEERVVQIQRLEIDKDSEEILGYRHKTTGNYIRSGNKLSFFNLTIYNNDDSKGSYSEIEDLIKESENGSYDLTFEIGEDGKRLTFFYPPCGELANCIATQSFIKAV